jgi:hypothetical protein
MTTSFPKISVVQPGQRIFYTDAGVAIFQVPSNPEGIVAAGPGSFAIDNAGNWWKKAGHGASGWSEVNVGGGGGAPRYLPPLTSPVTMAGTGQPLQQYVIPAGTLISDGDMIKYAMAGTVGPPSGGASNFRSIQPQIITAGALVQVLSAYPVAGGFQSQGIAQDNTQFIGATGWRIFGDIVRTSINALIFTATLVYGFLGAFNDGGIFVNDQGGYWLSGIFVGAPRSMNMTDQFTLQAVSLADTAGELVQNLTTVEVITF